MIAKYEAGMHVRVIQGEWGEFEYEDVFNPEKEGMSMANIQAGINQGKLLLIEVTAEIEDKYGTRYRRHLGRGKYDVIQGKRLNDVALTKTEAIALEQAGV